MTAHFADGGEITDHTSGGAKYDRRKMLAVWQGLLRARDGTYRIEPLATLGDSLALCRQSGSASGVIAQKFDVGAVEFDSIILVEVDGQGRRGRTEIFAADRLGEALVRLCEHYAELLPDGPDRSRTAAAARALAAALGPFDLDRYATGFAPEIVYVDSRTLGLPPAHGAEAVLHLLGTLLEVADDVTTRIDDVLALRPDALLLRWMNFGTDRTGGGAYERHFLWLGVSGPDGLLTRIELFDEDRDAEALARFDELVGESQAPRVAPAPSRAMKRRVRANAATAHVARVDAVIAARDADALPALFADESEVIDHITNVAFDRQGVLGSWRALLKAENPAVVHEMLATLGDSLVLCRRSMSASGFVGRTFDVGAYEQREINLTEVDAEERHRRAERFDVDRLGHAVLRLYERYAELLPDGPARTRAAATARSVAAYYSGPFDPDRLAAVNAPDIEVVDHRILGHWFAHGAEALLRQNRSWLDVADDFAVRDDDILALEPGALLSRRTFSGIDRAGGGTFERQFVLLCSFGTDGLVTHTEYFDADRDAEALARFDELTAESARTEFGTAPSRPVDERAHRVGASAARIDEFGPRSASGPVSAFRAARFENGATRAVERISEAWAARAWGRYVDIFPPGYRFIDRQRMARFETDRDRWFEVFRPFFEMTSSVTSEALATRGERLALIRSLWIGADRDSGPSEIEWLTIIEVDDSGAPAAAVTFDADALDAAYTELDDRYAAGEAAPYARTLETFLRIGRAAAARDWEQLAAVFAPDVVFEDHRPLGWGTLRSSTEYVASVRALLDLRSDARVRVDHVLALDDRRSLTVAGFVGNEAEGAFEMPVVVVMEYGLDGIRRWHSYTLDQLDAARARFEALGEKGRARDAGETVHPVERGGRPDPARDPLATLARPNAATAAKDRVEAAFEARDWAALRALYVTDARIEDRRRRALISYGVDELIADRQRWARAEEHGERRLVGTAGDRVALERVLRTSGPPDGRSEFEHLSVTEVDESGRIATVAVFDLDDWRAAQRDALASMIAGDPVAPA
jgi:hypothetical protein